MGKVGGALVRGIQKKHYIPLYRYASLTILVLPYLCMRLSKLR